MGGPWVHPEIDNPEYNEDEAKTIGKYDENCKLGFDLWQVKSGTIFDNVLITDDAEDAEKKMKDEQDEAEKKKAEEEAKSAGDDVDEDDEDLDDEEPEDGEDSEEPADDEEDDAGHDEL